MHFYGIPLMYPYKPSGRWQDVLGTLCWFLLYKYINNARFQKSKSLMYIVKKFVSTEKMQVVPLSTESWGLKSK